MTNIEDNVFRDGDRGVCGPSPLPTSAENGVMVSYLQPDLYHYCLHSTLYHPMYAKRIACLENYMLKRFNEF